MKSMIRKGIFALGMIAGMQAQAISVVPADLDIDFRSSAWQSADGQNPYSVGNTTATASADVAGAILFSDWQDGLGVREPGYELDEIDSTEKLTLDFAYAIDIDQIWITDLFEAPDGSSAMGEIGHADVYFENGTTQTFTFYGINSDQQNGDQAITLAGTDKATKVVFYAEAMKDEFSVAGISVPEPATLVLFGLGLAGLGAARRKQA